MGRGASQIARMQGSEAAWASSSRTVPPATSAAVSCQPMPRQVHCRLLQPPRARSAALRTHHQLGGCWVSPHCEHAGDGPWMPPGWGHPRDAASMCPAHTPSFLMQALSDAGLPVLRFTCKPTVLDTRCAAMKVTLSRVQAASVTLCRPACCCAMPPAGAQGRPARRAHRGQQRGMHAPCACRRCWIQLQTCMTASSRSPLGWWEVIPWCVGRCCVLLLGASLIRR
jgi:hypothetical protein